MYSSVYIYPIEYYQVYYYAYNHLTELNSLAGSSSTLTTASNGEYAFPLSSILNLGTLPNYYKAILAIKYTASTAIALTLTATTPSSTQTETMSLAASTSPNSLALTSTVVHSYNLKVSPNATVSIIEFSLRLFKCSAGCMICLNQQLC